MIDEHDHIFVYIIRSVSSIRVRESQKQTTTTTTNMQIHKQEMKGHTKNGQSRIQVRRYCFNLKTGMFRKI